MLCEYSVEDGGVDGAMDEDIRPVCVDVENILNAVDDGEGY